MPTRVATFWAGTTTLPPAAPAGAKRAEPSRSNCTVVSVGTVATGIARHTPVALG